MKPDIERARHLMQLADRCQLRVLAKWAEMHAMRRAIVDAGGMCSTMLGKASGSPLVYETTGYEHYAVSAGEPGSPEVRPDLAVRMRELNNSMAIRTARTQKLREAAAAAIGLRR